MSESAEILVFTCDLCGDVLATDRLSTEIEMCRCGTTALEHGAVSLTLDAVQ